MLPTQTKQIPETSEVGTTASILCAALLVVAVLMAAYVTYWEDDFVRLIMDW